jgi:hypothetical protein
VGETFLLRAFVQDTRPSPSGLAYAFLDVNFDGSLAAASGEITLGHGVGHLHSGAVTSGQLQRVGGEVSEAEQKGAERLLFSLAFTANSIGSVVFSPDLADNPYYMLFYGPFGSIPLAKTEVGGQNQLNPFDVNQDTYVSALDVGLVINHLNEFGATNYTGPGAYLDVDGDGYVTPRDARLVINRLNGDESTYFADPIVSADVSFQGATIDITAVPAPSALVSLLGLGMTVGGIWWRRKRRD